MPTLPFSPVPIDTADAGALGARTTASALESSLRQDLMRGTFPAGSKLRIRELAAHYDVGTIPLREALSRLASTGFVVAIDQKGFRVAEISVAELRDITSTRQRLEQMALTDAIALADPAWEGAVLAAYHRLKRIPLYAPGSAVASNPEWEQAHEVFHETLLSGCSSAWIRKFCGVLRDQTARYRSISVGVGHAHGRDVDAEHAAIVQAVLAHDADTAGRLLTAHFAETTQLVLALLAQQEAAAKAPRKRASAR